MSKKKTNISLMEKTICILNIDFSKEIDILKQTQAEKKMVLKA